MGRNRLCNIAALIILLVASASSQALGSTEVITYSYNTRLRLINTNYDDEIVISYVYDDSGNRLTKTITVSTSPTNSNPVAASYSVPANGAADVETNVILSWVAATDPDSTDQIFYDVYVGTSPDPRLVRSSLTATTFDIELAQNTTYYWKVVAKDNHNAESSGPVWSFTTGMGPEVVADFRATKTQSLGPEVIYFTDLTRSEYSIVSWKWDLNGDGQIDSTLQNPYFNYPTEGGIYTVSLEVTDEYGNADTNTKISYIKISADADSDGVAGEIDNCPDHYNPQQEDSDEDSIGDSCDDCPIDSINDPDNDGICGLNDNCPWAANSDQSDSDGDGIGDVCQTDADSDGVLNEDDNCPGLYNPEQLDSDGDGLGDACTVSHCVANVDQLMDAIDVAESNDMDNVIMLQQDTYTIPSGSYITIEPSDEKLIAIKGGYSVHCLSRELDPDNTIIDSEDGNNAAIRFTSQVYSENSFTALLLEGVTVKTAGQGYEIEAYADSGDIRLINNIFNSNTLTTSYTGGLHLTNYSGNIELTGNEIDGTQSELHRGIYISMDTGDIKITNNIISDNQCDTYCGGLFIYSRGRIDVLHNVITGNRSLYTGGGISITNPKNDATTNISGNIIANNMAWYAGGVYLDLKKYLYLINNTITNNIAEDYWGSGGGVYLDLRYGSIAELYNNIIWGNNASDGGDIYNYQNRTVNVFNNNFDPDKVSGRAFTSEGNNINVDPLFIDPLGLDFHIDALSQVKDAGSDTAPNLPSTDIDSDDRNIGINVDMGADEVNE